jgi:hypothetical protein
MVLNNFYHYITQLQVRIWLESSTALLTKVYRKHTHTGSYLHFSSNCPPYVKRGVVHSLINRAITLWTKKQGYSKEVVKIRQDVATNEYPQHLIDSVLKSSGAKSWREADEIRLSTVVIPYVKGILEKFRHIGERYNIKTVFKTRQTLRRMLTRTWSHREVQNASTVFLVNVVGVTSGKQADHSAYGYNNIWTTYNRDWWRNPG